MLRLRAPLGPLTETSWPSILISTPCGSLTGFLATRDIVTPYQNTVQSTSPPTPAARAARSVITPLLVETIDTPSPPLTLGSWSADLYWRRPGRLTRLKIGRAHV